MMYSIDILGSFDFLEQEIRIGTLEYERLKGSPSYRFTYDQGFLNRFRGISLSADIGNFLGVQAASKSIFSMLGDALPDRWGKALIDKRERLEAETAQRVPRVLMISVSLLLQNSGNNTQETSGSPQRSNDVSKEGLNTCLKKRGSCFRMECAN